MEVTIQSRAYQFIEEQPNYTIKCSAYIEVIKNSFSICGYIENKSSMLCSFSYEWSKGGDIISKSIMDMDKSTNWDPIIQDFMERAYEYISHQTNEPL